MSNSGVDFASLPLYTKSKVDFAPTERAEVTYAANPWNRFFSFTVVKEQLYINGGYLKDTGIDRETGNVKFQKQVIGFRKEVNGKKKGRVALNVEDVLEYQRIEPID